MNDQELETLRKRLEDRLRAIRPRILAPHMQMLEDIGSLIHENDALLVDLVKDCDFNELEKLEALFDHELFERARDYFEESVINGYLREQAVDVLVNIVNTDLPESQMQAAVDSHPPLPVADHLWVALSDCQPTTLGLHT